MSMTTLSDLKKSFIGTSKYVKISSISGAQIIQFMKGHQNSKTLIFFRVPAIPTFPIAIFLDILWIEVTKN